MQSTINRHPAKSREAVSYERGTPVLFDPLVDGLLRRNVRLCVSLNSGLKRIKKKKKWV